MSKADAPHAETALELLVFNADHDALGGALAKLHGGARSETIEIYRAALPGFTVHQIYGRSQVWLNIAGDCSAAAASSITAKKRKGACAAPQTKKAKKDLKKFSPELDNIGVSLVMDPDVGKPCKRTITVYNDRLPGFSDQQIYGRGQVWVNAAAARTTAAD